MQAFFAGQILETSNTHAASDIAALTSTLTSPSADQRKARCAMAYRLHRTFKFAHLVRMPDEGGVIPEDEICSWLALQLVVPGRVRTASITTGRAEPIGASAVLDPASARPLLPEPAIPPIK